MLNSESRSITDKQAMQTRTLWLAVILQAIFDYKETLTGKFQKSYEKRNVRTGFKLARVTPEYFYSEGFEEVCFYAGVESSQVREQLSI